MTDTDKTAVDLAIVAGRLRLMQEQGNVMHRRPWEMIAADYALAADGIDTIERLQAENAALRADLAYARRFL